MRVFLFSLSVVVLAAFVWIGDYGYRGIPPVAAMINPISGVWRNPTRDWPKELKLELGVSRPVTIVRDQFRIPHIFAENSRDLYFAQGFAMAQDRLFQMDIVTRVMLGRLSEVAGQRAANLDKFFVATGMRESIRRTLSNIQPESKAAMEPFLAGVNSYIDSLDGRTMPPEYKIMGFKPEHFTFERTFSLLQYMVWNLAGKNNELLLSHLEKQLGRGVVEKLYPIFPKMLAPIMPDTPKGLQAPEGQALQPFASVFDDLDPFLQPITGNGSNNWAVGKQKSVSGNTLLANDTHLSLTLPGIWYENHLVTPEQNVYGGSLIGAPGIIVGFNKKIAWAVTNAPVDVSDFLEVPITGDNYSFAGENRKLTKISETIRVKDAAPIKLDQEWTHSGVVLRKRADKALVFRFVSHLGKDNLATFLKLDVAQNYQECKSAVQIYQLPAQNFICADKDNIGIFEQGYVPKTALSQARRWILDGSLKGSDWGEGLSFSELPHLENPKRGFVFSANQTATGPDYPFYLSYRYNAPFRALRIQHVLEAKDKLNVEDMRRLQMDETSVLAEKATPILLKHIDRNVLSSDEGQALAELQMWNFTFSLDSVAATVFSEFWRNLEHQLWAGPIGADQSQGWPNENITLDLLSDPNSELAKKFIGSIAKLLTDSFRMGIADLTTRYGSFSAHRADWLWGKTHVTTLLHVARIPGLERHTIMGGDENAPQANKGQHAAAWRMVVELGDEVKGFTNYPGGESGNPFDVEYTRFVEGWSKGELRPAQFVRSPEEITDSEKSVWRLLPR